MGCPFIQTEQKEQAEDMGRALEKRVRMETLQTTLDWETILLHLTSGKENNEWWGEQQLPSFMLTP